MNRRLVRRGRYGSSLLAWPVIDSRTAGPYVYGADGIQAVQGCGADLVSAACRLTMRALRNRYSTPSASRV